MRSARVRRRRRGSGLSLAGREVMVGRRGNHRLSQVRENGNQGVAMIESSSLFKGLPGDILDKIAKLRVRRRLKPGEILFRKGDPGDALYGVMAGRLRIHANATDGPDALLNIIGPGDVFGEIALIDGLPRTAHATPIHNGDLV